MGGAEPARTLVRGGARRRASGRDREQAPRGASRPGAGAGVPRVRRAAALRGGGRRRHPRARPAGAGPGRQPGGARARDRQRDDQLHPHRDGARGPELRGGARGRPGTRLCGGGPDGRRRGHGRRQQAGDPGPARVRRLDRPGRGGQPPGTTSGAAGRPGITGVTAEDVAALGDEGRIARLLATARLAEDGAIEADVVPSAVPAGSPFGRCDGVLNRIEVDASPVGRVAFEGPGAGGAAADPPSSGTSSRSRATSGPRGPGSPARRPSDPGSPFDRLPRNASPRRPAPATPWPTDADVDGEPPRPPPARHLVERYRAFLPVTDATPVCRWARAPRRWSMPAAWASRWGCATCTSRSRARTRPAPSRTGAWSMAVAKALEAGAPERHLRLDRQHLGLGGGVRGRRRARVRRRPARPARSPSASCSRRSSPAPASSRCDGNFDEALRSSARSPSRTTTRSRS